MTNRDSIVKDAFGLPTDEYPKAIDTLHFSPHESDHKNGPLRVTEADSRDVSPWQGNRGLSPVVRHKVYSLAVHDYTFHTLAQHYRTYRSIGRTGERRAAGLAR